MIRMAFLSMGLLVLLNLNGQNLTTHKWENRVVVIQTSSELNKTYLAQIEAFINLEEEFRERKLIIYTVIGNKYKLTDYQKEKAEASWLVSTKIYGDLLDQRDPFKIILIGLDGGIKLAQQEVLPAGVLFETIDAMPMRRAELRNKN